MKKIGFIILAVVLALGAVGAAYAAWSQTLTVGVNATTAKFDVNFTAKADPTAPTGGSAISNISNPKAATIAVTNAYPNYTGSFKLTVTNNGTIPVNAVLSEVTDTGSLFEATPATALIQAGASQDYTVTMTVPNWTNNLNENQTYTASYTVVATQAP
jgi:hypothetical protein